MRIIYLFIVLLACSSEIVYSSVPKDDKKKNEEGTEQIVEPEFTEGIVYALPRTALIMNIEAKKKVFKPGPYYQYAKKYLGIDNARATEEVKWNISSIEIDQYPEADPNAIFKAMDEYASQLALSSNGVIAGVNTKDNSKKIKIVGADFIEKSKNKPAEFTDLSSDEFYEILVDPETGIETIKAKSIEEKARETADYIIRLRKKRAFSILSPSDVIPEDGKGYEVFVKEAKRLDKEYMALFIGKESVSSQCYQIIYIPETGNVKNEVIFRFSKENGMLPKSDISGKPIFLSLEKEQNANSALKKLKDSENPNAGKSGIFYRMPVSASISISDGLETLYLGRACIPQFGEIIPLPENFLDGNYQIKFNVDTGSVKSIVENQ